MVSLSDKLNEDFNHIQQQFDEWSPFEQFILCLELTKKLQLSYRYFLSQLIFQKTTKQENNDMFQHTVHQANTPAILGCLLSDSVDKIISTLLLYLPLVSTTTTNEKLLESYRDVFINLNSKLLQTSNLSYTDQQLIEVCQQIQFFIQINPCLQKYLVDLPQLNALASMNKITSDDKSLSTSPKQHQPLQRYSAVRLYKQTSPLPAPLMNFSSETTTANTNISPQLLRDASDSGVDLSEPTVNSILITQNCQHTIIGRSHSANLTLTNGQDNQNNHHAFVVKTSSSPTPEQTVPITTTATSTTTTTTTTTNRSTFAPLSAVLSAPAQSIQSYYSDIRHQNSTYSHQQINPTLTISDEDEEDAQNFLNNHNSQILPSSIENFYSDNNNHNNNNRLRQFSSLRNRTGKNLHNNLTNSIDGVSQYLGIDGHTGSVKNTFIQPNSGMRDVPKWLKNLRLHKYAFFFSQMTYDEMMNLNIEQLKEGKITDGACTKILLNIKKLKESQSLLHQCLIDIDNGQIDLKCVLQQLNELMFTPIRTKQIDNDEDLPDLIMKVLEKIYQQITSSNSSTNLLSDMGNNLVGLFDRCYKHEAFSNNQREILLRWRGPLCNKLQTSGKIEFKSMQSSSSLNRRVQLKPQTSMGNMNTTQISKPAIRNIKSTNYYSNYSINSVPLTRQQQLNSDCPNDNNTIRRPTKSPTLIFTTNNDANDETSNHLSIVSNHSLNDQTKSFLTERLGNGTGNFRPTFNYLTSTPQRNNNMNNTNGGYLAANQHQLLTRKTSVGPYSETQGDDKTKLCKTYSDPNKIRFYNSSPMTTNNTSNGLSSQQGNYQLTNPTIYPPRQYLSRSQPAPVNSNQFYDANLLHESPIQKSYSDRETSIFYGHDNPNQISSSSDENNTQHSYNQRHNSTDFETFCREITESALSDDVHDVPIDHLKSPSNNSTDTEQ